METGVNLTGYDFIVIGLFVLFIGRGIWVGFLRQVTGLLSLYIAYYVASQYHDRLFPFLTDISEPPKVVFIASVVILFIATYIVSMLVGKGLAYVTEITLSKWFDRFLGAFLGATIAVIVTVMLHMILGSILPPENKMLRDCQTCEGLNRASDYARQFIRDEDVRKSLMQQAPAISTEDVRQFLEGTNRQQPEEEKSPPVEE